MYAIGSFWPCCNRGSRSVSGDADSTRTSDQVDIGLRGDYGAVSLRRPDVTTPGSTTTYTYDATDPTPPESGNGFYSVAFTNTDLATIAGFEAFQEYDMTGWMTGFATIQYAEGLDHSRNAPRPHGVGHRLRNNNPNDNNAQRSIRTGSDDGALPGFAPLECACGRARPRGSSRSRWNVELAARMVASKAGWRSPWVSARPPGSRRSICGATGRSQAVVDVRRDREPHRRFYREHLDLRNGRGVYQPGISGYFGSELVY